MYHFASMVSCNSGYRRCWYGSIHIYLYPVLWGWVQQVLTRGQSVCEFPWDMRENSRVLSLILKLDFWMFGWFPLCRELFLRQQISSMTKAMVEVMNHCWISVLDSWGGSRTNLMISSVLWMWCSSGFSPQQLQNQRALATLQQDMTRKDGNLFQSYVHIDCMMYLWFVSYALDCLLWAEHWWLISTK